MRAMPQLFAGLKKTGSRGWPNRQGFSNATGGSRQVAPSRSICSASLSGRSAGTDRRSAAESPNGTSTPRPSASSSSAWDGRNGGPQAAHIVSAVAHQGLKELTYALAAHVQKARAEHVVVEPTFHKDVLPIIQARCQECHRPGEAGPIADEFAEHPAVRVINFTGSTKVFQHLWRTVGDNIARLSEADPREIVAAAQLADDVRAATGFPVDVPDDVATTRMVATPVDFHGTPWAPRRTAPAPTPSGWASTCRSARCC